jgi:hypothetical protein
VREIETGLNWVLRPVILPLDKKIPKLNITGS